MMKGRGCAIDIKTYEPLTTHGRMGGRPKYTGGANESYVTKLQRHGLDLGQGTRRDVPSIPSVFLPLVIIEHSLTYQAAPNSCASTASRRVSILLLRNRQEDVCP